MKLHENYVKELKKYYKNHRELPKDFDKGFFGRSTTETLIYSLPEDALWIDDEDDVNYRNCVPPGKEYSVNWYSIDQTTRGGYYSKSNSIGKEFSMIMYTRSYYFFEGKEFGVNEDMSFEELNDTIENDNPDYGLYTPECDFWTNSLDFNIKTFKPIKCAPIFKPNDYFEFENFNDYELFDTPKIYWEYTTKKLLTSEFIDGVRIDEIHNLKTNINVKKLTTVASEIFFYQTFRDGFFHGDLHPGNIFINQSGKIIAIDFGIMGYLNLNDRKFLAKLFNFLLNKEFFKIVKLHQENGMLDKDTDLHKLTQEIRILATPILNKPIGDISMGHLFGEILALSRKFNIKIQAKFCLLQKSMIMAEGIARQINPKANIWQTTEPLMEEWINDNMKYDFLFEKINDKSFFSKELFEIFQKIDKILKKIFSF